jgi:hypothetical protein
MVDFDARSDATQPPGDGLELGHRICARYGNSPGLARLPDVPAVVARNGRFSAEHLPLLASLQRRWSNSPLLPRGWVDPIYAWPVFASAHARSKGPQAGAPSRPARNAAFRAVPISPDSASGPESAQATVSPQPGQATTDSAAPAVPAAAAPAAPHVSPVLAAGPARLGRPVFKRQVREILPTRPGASSAANAAASIQRKAAPATPHSEPGVTPAADTGRHGNDGKNAAGEGYGLSARIASPDSTPVQRPLEIGAHRDDLVLAEPFGEEPAAAPSGPSEILAGSPSVIDVIAAVSAELRAETSTSVSPRVFRTPENAVAGAEVVHMRPVTEEGGTHATGIRAEAESAEPVTHTSIDAVGSEQSTGHRIAASALVSPRDPEIASKPLVPAGMVPLRTTAGTTAEAHAPIQATVDTDRPDHLDEHGVTAHQRTSMVQPRASAEPASAPQVPIQAEADTNRPEQSADTRLVGSVVTSAESSAPSAMAQLQTAGAPKGNPQVHLQANVEPNRPERPAEYRLVGADVPSAEHSGPAAPASNPLVSIQANVETDRPGQPAEYRLAGHAVPSAENSPARAMAQLRTAGASDGSPQPTIQAKVDANRRGQPTEHRVEEPGLSPTENGSPATTASRPTLRAGVHSGHRIAATATLLSEKPETASGQSGRAGMVQHKPAFQAHEVVPAPALTPTPLNDPGAASALPVRPAEVATQGKSADHAAPQHRGAAIIQRKAAESDMAKREYSISRRDGESANQAQVHLPSIDRGSREGPSLPFERLQVDARFSKPDAALSDVGVSPSNAAVQAPEPVLNRAWHDRETHAPAASLTHRLAEFGQSTDSDPLELTESAGRPLADGEVTQPGFDRPPQPSAEHDAAPVIIQAGTPAPMSNAGSAIEHLEPVESLPLSTFAGNALTYGAIPESSVEGHGAPSPRSLSDSASAIAHRHIEPVLVGQHHQPTNPSMPPRVPALERESGSPSPIDGRVTHATASGSPHTSGTIPNSGSVIQRQPALNSSPHKTTAQSSPAPQLAENRHIEHRLPSLPETPAGRSSRTRFGPAIAIASAESPNTQSLPAVAVQASVVGLPRPAMVHGPHPVQRFADALGGPSSSRTTANSGDRLTAYPPGARETGRSLADGSGNGRLVNRMAAASAPRAGNSSAVPPAPGAEQSKPNRPPAPSPDINGVVDQVYQMLVRRLASERLRKGL